MTSDFVCGPRPISRHIEERLADSQTIRRTEDKSQRTHDAVHVFTEVGTSNELLAVTFCKVSDRKFRLDNRSVRKWVHRMNR